MIQREIQPNLAGFSKQALTLADKIIDKLEEQGNFYPNPLTFLLFAFKIIHKT